MHKLDGVAHELVPAHHLRPAEPLLLGGVFVDKRLPKRLGTVLGTLDELRGRTPARLTAVEKLLEPLEGRHALHELQELAIELA